MTKDNSRSAPMSTIPAPILKTSEEPSSTLASSSAMGAVNPPP
eukprot:CAMPEP_0118962166 /NCGR_PEP_ID=MMETSP1173-20130426/592_1 /TAXON_ID=1034831 /ORGANISM="Rhizochromulina marina cf, Strain CCMP1243" /LENGTH=42 /DNA_ID= /DNA_START= /DNA_END= /DNA_ORIENTATION=